MPSIVAWLGYGGLIPFVVLAAATLAGGRYSSVSSRGLITYGAVILSFVGAVNWGFAMTLSGLNERQRTHFWIWSVVPALVAWVALFLPPFAAGLTLVGAFLAQYWQDRRLVRTTDLPLWYAPLRLRLTLAACICLAAGGFASPASGASPPSATPATPATSSALAAPFTPTASSVPSSSSAPADSSAPAATSPPAASSPTAASSPPAGSSTPPPPGYREGRASRDGIGKFYQGREIAQVMGFEGASWLERPTREQEERPDWLVDELRLKPGMVVADIGAGSGYLSRRMAPLVAPGKVFAVDVQPEMVRLLQKLSTEPDLGNVVAVQGAPDDVSLPANSVDLAVMVDVYHELAFPYEVMQSLVRAVKPGGRVVFVEYRAEDPNVPILELHKMSEAQIRREMRPLPLVWERDSERLPLQHIVVFRKG